MTLVQCLGGAHDGLEIELPDPPQYVYFPLAPLEDVAAEAILNSRKEVYEQTTYKVPSNGACVYFYRGVRP
jgi:hypothetical protein